VPDAWEPIPPGLSAIRRRGSDVTLISLGVGVHRALEASERLAAERGVEAEVIDLRSVRPLDRAAVCDSVRSTGRLVVVDEDYTEFGLSGELAAVLMEAGITARYARVGVDDTIPYDMRRERQALPNAARIMAAVGSILSG
jgi:pyruvate dehydrogenase E1 component beta subunit